MIKDNILDLEFYKNGKNKIKIGELKQEIIELLYTDRILRCGQKD